VWDRIQALEDCDALQAEFETASANHERKANEASTDVMVAVDDRMKDVGCY